MNRSFNKYWIVVSVMIVINILIFVNMSRSLETFVVNHIIDTQIVDFRN